MKRKSHSLIIFLLATILLQSCQTGHELHYFKAGGNYYRIKINEKSFASKARYLSGYYDDKAVDKYFSEMSQPKESEQKAEDVTFIKPVSTTTGSDHLVIDSNKQFVMILSTNSDAVSEQIGAFADNEIILESIARLANKDKVDESNNYLADVTKSHDRNKAVIQLGDQFIASLADTDDNIKVKNNILIFLQNLKAQNKGNVNGASIELLIKEFQKR